MLNAKQHNSRKGLKVFGSYRLRPRNLFRESLLNIIRRGEGISMPQFRTNNQTDNTPHWYVLTIPRSSTRACDLLATNVEQFNIRSGAHLDYFAPTFVDITTRSNCRGNTRKPLLYNYIFINGTLPELRRFHTFYPTCNLIPVGAKRDCPTDYRYVSDEEMAHFMRIAQAYENAVPCFSPSEIDLEHGDKVRIIGGQFSGVEGVLLSQQGRDGGRVIVKITDMLAVETLDIRPEYLQIIEFAQGSKHIYDKLDGYLPKIRRALTASLLQGEADPKDLTAIRYFLTRYGNITLAPGSKIRGKYMALLMLSHYVLGHTKEYEHCKQACTESLPQITNPETRATILGFLYACSREQKWLDEARSIVAAWGDGPSLTPARRTVAEELTAYEKSIASQR